MRLVSFLFCISFLVAAQAKAERILIIGDSLTCGHFGANVVSNLRASGNTVTVFCAVSSEPSNWLNGKNPPGQICQTMSASQRVLVPCVPNGQVPKLDTVLANNPADRIIVGLGTNSLFLRAPTPAYETMARAVRAKARCQWIGPPHLRPDQAIGWSGVRGMKRGSAEDLRLSRINIQNQEDNLPGFVTALRPRVEGSGCSFTDSQRLTESGPAHESSDGVHKGPIAGRAWAAAIRPLLDPPVAAVGGSSGVGATSRRLSR